MVKQSLVSSHLLPDGKALLLFAPVSSVTFPGDFLAASRPTLLVF